MANPKPPSLQDRLQALQADEPAPETEKAPESTSGSDPVENLVNWGASKLPESTPDWLRTVGRYTIPQNTPEAVTAAALAPLGGPAGGLAAKVGLKALAKRSLPAFLARTGLTAAATGAAGAATGHDPTASAVEGAAARVVGEPVGAALKAVVQSKVVKKMTGQMTSRLADSFRDLIGPWLPEGATDARVIQDVIADGPSSRVSAAITELRKKNAATPVNILDLEPGLEKSGVVHAWQPGESAGRGRVDPKTVKAGTVWPPTREFEASIGPGTALSPYGKVSKIETGLVPFGSIDAQIETRINELRKMVADGIAERPDHLAIMELEKARMAIAERVQDPQMQNALKEFGRTKQLRDLLWGATRAPANRGEAVLEDLIDAKTGGLTAKGVTTIQGRLATNAPKLHSFRPDEIAALQHAVNLDLALGGARAEAGRGLAALIPSMSFYGPIPHVHWSGNRGPSPGSMPGWEGARNAAQKVLPDALRVFLGLEAAKGAEEIQK
jgi:hypothetical protein